jgi:aldehyde dehydrogenase (NAD+)
MALDDLWFDPSLCFIANEWVAPFSGQYLELTNPSNGLPLCQIARGQSTDIDQAVDAATFALDSEWGRLTAPERGRILYRMSQLVTEKADQLARLESLDVGKPLTQAKADALALARL